MIGLKENVIMGHLIPAGTGLKRFKKIRVWKEEDETDENDAITVAENTEEETT